MIEVKHLSKSFGKKPVLNDISFSVQTGEVTALIGLNGSGKTTIMKAMMKLTTYDAGEILLDGKSITLADYHRIVYVPDEISVIKGMTIAESLAFMKDHFPNYNSKKASEIIEFFRLNYDDRINSLSKGNVSKVNILLSLAIDSDYIILDEPFSGIDIITREEIANVFVSELFQGKGVLISTHEIEDIEHLIDKVVMIDDGKLLKEFYLEDERLETGKSIREMMREVI